MADEVGYYIAADYNGGFAQEECAPGGDVRRVAG